MGENKLTQEAKDAIRGYMVRLVALPGVVVALAAFALGFFLNEVARQGAFNEAYKDASIHILKLGVKASEAVTKAENSKALVENLVDEVKGTVEKSNELERRLETANALTIADNLVNQVAETIVSQRNFSDDLKGEFGVRLNELETLLDGTRKNEERCSWTNVGYNKSHGHDNNRWCPKGSYISQLDIDSCSKGPDCPVIRSVRCCSVLP